jgi:hypothetical protein
VNDAAAIQGDPLPGFSASYTGLKLADTADVVSGVVFSTPATAGSLPGDYVITATGGTATNYVIVERNDGTLSIVQSAGQTSAVQQLQSDLGSDLPPVDLNEPAEGDAADVALATSTGAVQTGSDGENGVDVDDSTASDLICLMADERECPVVESAAE